MKTSPKEPTAMVNLRLIMSEMFWVKFAAQQTLATVNVYWTFDERAAQAEVRWHRANELEQAVVDFFLGVTP